MARLMRVHDVRFSIFQDYANLNAQRIYIVIEEIFYLKLFFKLKLAIRLTIVSF